MTDIIIPQKTCIQCGKELKTPQTQAEMIGYVLKRYCSSKCGFEARRPSRELNKREREERRELALACGMTWREMEELEFRYRFDRSDHGKEVAYERFIQALDVYRTLSGTQQTGAPAIT